MSYGCPPTVNLEYFKILDLFSALIYICNKYFTSTCYVKQFVSVGLL